MIDTLQKSELVRSPRRGELVNATATDVPYRFPRFLKGIGGLPFAHAKVFAIYAQRCEFLHGAGVRVASVDAGVTGGSV